MSGVPEDMPLSAFERRWYLRLGLNEDEAKRWKLEGIGPFEAERRMLEGIGPFEADWVGHEPLSPLIDGRVDLLPALRLDMKDAGSSSPTDPRRATWEALAVGAADHYRITVTEIAELLGVTPGAISHLRAATGTSDDGFPAPVDAGSVPLYAAGDVLRWATRVGRLRSPGATEQPVVPRRGRKARLAEPPGWDWFWRLGVRRLAGVLLAHDDLDRYATARSVVAWLVAVVAWSDDTRRRLGDDLAAGGAGDPVASLRALTKPPRDARRLLGPLLPPVAGGLLDEPEVALTLQALLATLLLAVDDGGYPAAYLDAGLEIVTAAVPGGQSMGTPPALARVLTEVAVHELPRFPSPDPAPKDQLPTVLDPCCGDGELLVRYRLRRARALRLLGWDIDPSGVAITRLRLALRAMSYDGVELPDALARLADDISVRDVRSAEPEPDTADEIVADLPGDADPDLLARLLTLPRRALRRRGMAVLSLPARALEQRTSPPVADLLRDSGLHTAIVVPARVRADSRSPFVVMVLRPDVAPPFGRVRLIDASSVNLSRAGRGLTTSVPASPSDDLPVHDLRRALDCADPSQAEAPGLLVRDLPLQEVLEQLVRTSVGTPPSDSTAAAGRRAQVLEAAEHLRSLLAQPHGIRYTKRVEEALDALIKRIGRDLNEH